MQGKFEHLQAEFQDTQTDFEHLQAEFQDMQGEFEHLQAEFQDMQVEFEHLQAELKTFVRIPRRINNTVLLNLARKLLTAKKTIEKWD